MARYQPHNPKQDKMIPLSYADQIVAGSFEFALDEIVEEHLDLRVFERRASLLATAEPRILSTTQAPGRGLRTRRERGRRRVAAPAPH